ncbi:MAG: polysaccharide pyruvyl transferase family protein, partial [Prevotellaceae bacterium]|nr:polysaccharide pyruvyl transferase family protein [Prevotellaceae bacterium]
MKKITFVGLYSANIGDIVIADCTEYLFKEQFGNILSEKVDLNFQNRNILFIKTLKILRKLSLSKIRFLLLKESYKRHYEKQIDKNSDLIVIVGGGILKFKYENFAPKLVALIDCAEKNNIPVIMNAIGVEGFSKENIGCKWLHKAINRAINKTINKAITTRDDIDSLNNEYL